MTYYVLVSFVSLIVGIVIGKYLLTSKSNAAKELYQTREELESIKAKLKHHLSQNVVLFKQLDDSYQKLFKQFGETVDDISTALSDTNRTNGGNTPNTFELLSNREMDNLKEHTAQQPKDY
jgi:uncharacterized membrane-anchored protein YhcB (DUF1043 family)